MNGGGGKGKKPLISINIIYCIILLKAHPCLKLYDAEIFIQCYDLLLQSTLAPKWPLLYPAGPDLPPESLLTEVGLLRSVPDSTRTNKEDHVRQSSLGCVCVVGFRCSLFTVSTSILHLIPLPTFPSSSLMPSLPSLCFPPPLLSRDTHHLAVIHSVYPAQRHSTYWCWRLHQHCMLAASVKVLYDIFATPQHQQSKCWSERYRIGPSVVLASIPT